jgi:hypothetical protein
MNTECPLRVINRDRLLAMGLASSLIIIGTVLLQVYVWLGIALVAFAWLFVIYNLFQTIPEKADIFIPAIGFLCISYLIFETTDIKMPAYIIYAVSWAVLGWVMSSHINDTWLGPFAALLIASSNVFIMPWQKQNNIVNGIGLPIITVGFMIVSVIHSYPTVETLKTTGPACINFLGTEIPELKPYTGEINCVLESGCFDDLLNMQASDDPKYIAEVVKAISCAGEKCDIFKQIATEIDCFITNCLPAILKAPPPTTVGWAAAILQAYMACGVTTCKLPGLFGAK